MPTGDLPASPAAGGRTRRTGHSQKSCAQKTGSPQSLIWAFIPIACCNKNAAEHGIRIHAQKTPAAARILLQGDALIAMTNSMRRIFHFIIILMTMFVLLACSQSQQEGNSSVQVDKPPAEKASTRLSAAS